MYTVATHSCISGHAWHCFLSINLIYFLLPQTWLVYFLISYQQLNKSLHYAQAFVSKTFHIVSLVLHFFLMKIQYRLVYFKEMLHSKIWQGRCVGRFVSRKKQGLLVGFSVTLTIFPWKSKNRLNISLHLLSLSQLNIFW